MYIDPNLKLYKNFNELQKDKPVSGYDWWNDEKKLRISDLSNFQLLVVLGEPGFGKTEFLKKVIEHSTNHSQSAIFIDLKKVDTGIELSDYISRKATNPQTLKTNEFIFSNNPLVIVCLDALDEVDRNKIIDVIERMKELIDTTKNIRIIITCRTLYYTTYYEEFRGTILILLR